MPFISVSEDLAAKGSTEVENKFITKYLPILDAQAVKVYLYALYVSRSGFAHFTAEDMAKRLDMSDEQLANCFEYLEEFELVSITSRSPLEIRMLDAENVYGSPKKLKPEKYSAFASSVQAVITGRMISPAEFMDYFYLLDEYSFEQNALLMIINYCVNLKGNDIKAAYIKKVAKNFAEDGITTAAKVEERLSSYTSATPALIKIFSAAGINRRPDPDDSSLYEKWTNELGFSDEAIVCAAKYFKAKTALKIDDALTELYKNRKFDSKEIEDYCKTRNSLYAAAAETAKALGIYIQDASPYVENYLGPWRDMGFEPDTLNIIAEYCFMQGKNSFDRMDEYVRSLADEGIITMDAVTARLEKVAADDKLIKNILSLCGLSRRITEYDRQCLKRWRDWNFSDDILLAAAKAAAGKNNPVAYMSAVLSSWKNEGVTTPDEAASARRGADEGTKALIEQHYYDLRAAARARAEKALAKALKDEIYGGIKKQLNSLAIKLAFAEVNDEIKAEELKERIAELEARGNERLKQLNIDKSDFEPKYKCAVCKDTGYTEDGKQCECLKKFIKANKL